MSKERLLKLRRVSEIVGASRATIDRWRDEGLFPEPVILRRRVVICPARTCPGITCATCKLCTRMRNTIVGLPELTGSNSNIYRKSRT